MNKEEELIDRLIDLAFAEDIGDGDHTTLSCIPATAMGKSKLLIKRARFIINALKLHPENKDYVFMAINDGRLEKLTPQSFQMKLYHICNRLGLEYKRINRNEAIVCKP